MMNRRSTMAELLLVCATLSIGCARDNRPVYVEPPLPDAEAARLFKSEGFSSNARVDEVDGARVDWARKRSIKVEPGEHRLLLVHRRSGGSVGIGGGSGIGLGVGVGVGSDGTDTASVTLNLEAGGEYLFNGPGAFEKPRRFKVIDRKTGVQHDVQ